MTSVTARPQGGRSLALHVAALFGLLALPIALYAVMLDAAWDGGDLSIDFTQTLLPAAERILDGSSPYPAYGYPPLVAFAFVPLALLPAPAPELTYTALLIAAVAASLRVLGVRDWRCYGAAFLWTPTYHAVQTGNVTILLLLGSALAWRFRESTRNAGVAAGLAIATKILCWPLVVWLAATRRAAAAVLALCVALGVTLLLWASLGFSGLLDYPSSLRGLETAQAPESYTVRALLIDAGTSVTMGQAVWTMLSLAVVTGCFIAGRRGADQLSFTLAMLACVVASPIVWLHSFALLLAPVALSRPRFHWVWLLPTALWFFASGNGNGAPWQTLLVLGVVLATLALAATPGLRKSSRRGPLPAGSASTGVDARDASVRTDRTHVPVR